MNYLASDSYLLDLLENNNLLSAEQRRFIVQKKEQQMQTLRRRQGGRRAGNGKGQIDMPPDLLDLILSFNFETPGQDARLLTEEMIMGAVATDRKMEFKKLDPLEIDLEIVTKSIPKSFAIKHLLLPFDLVNGVLQVAICEPGNQAALDEIERANQIKAKPYISTRSDIRRMLAEFFGFQKSISAAETHMAGPGVDLGNLEQYVKISSSKEIASSDQHIKSAVDHLFNYAFEQRASDIHIEPKRKVSLIRLRIDGMLHTIYSLPKAVHPAIVSRIKTLSRMNIAEKRRPQDGRIKVDRAGKEAEIRVSTIPVAFGEKAVLRILDADIIFQELENIGFSENDLSVYRGFLKEPHGIVLVTGPTGSGKSTTLYSTLKHIATPDKNIITVEDPVEMVHEEFNQIAVQPQVNVSFSTILRNILRQDPDVIMIGEIRDLETAAHAVQAAMTGHLVFSTLHTNDAVSSITRLLDLGVQPFLISSSLLGAMAQRLVRRICPHCIEKFWMTPQQLQGSGFPVEEEGDIELQSGKGCRNCRDTGYLGRCGVFEIFSMSDRLREMINSHQPETEMRKVAIEQGMTTLHQDAWEKVKNGITTYQEAMRVTGVS
jgi:general secretion pathway protein E